MKCSWLLGIFRSASSIRVLFIPNNPQTLGILERFLFWGVGVHSLMDKNPAPVEVGNLPPLFTRFRYIPGGARIFQQCVFWKSRRLVDWRVDVVPLDDQLEGSVSVPVRLGGNIRPLNKNHSHTIHVWHIYLHLVDVYGKCRQTYIKIYHTWMVWDSLHFFKTNFFTANT